MEFGDDDLKEEIRKEIGLIGMAHRTTYIMQSTIAHPNHMIEGFIRGLNARRPALFNIYASCQPEHGIGDDMGHHQAQLASESRAYPLFRYDPDAGATPQECFDLEGNPAVKEPWPTYTLHYKEGERAKTMELPLTFADFALTEARFRKHFRLAPRDAWNENMVELADFLLLDEDEAEGLFPFVWTVDRQGHLQRLMVAHPMVLSCKERQDFWVMLKAIARVGEDEPASHDLEEQIRQDVVNRLAAGLMSLVGAEGAQAARTLTAPPPSNGGAAAGGLAPWIDTAECTSCDECIKINPAIFEYDSDNKAIIKNAGAGPYKDLVTAAERCTARVIHPGLPGDTSAKGMDKLIKRAERFN